MVKFPTEHDVKKSLNKAQWEHSKNQWDNLRMLKIECYVLIRVSICHWLRLPVSVRQNHRNSPQS